MAIATTATIEAITGWDSTRSALVANHLDEAEVEAKEILSTGRSRSEATGTEGANNYTTVLDAESERYDEIVALGSGDKLYDALQRAEAKLAIYFGLAFMNLRPTPKGGLSRRIGNVEGQNDLMSTAELRAVRSEIYGQAVATLKKLYRAGEASEKTVYTL